ncbi:MAG: 4'-phosphopantetheinyl transferase family protein [Gammaproteobacteria bacterium]
MNAPPRSLKFRTNEFGKPRLAAPTGALQFNLTHSRNLGLLAVATHPVGIDVEYVDRNLDTEALAPHVFSDTELELVGHESAHERQQLFFRLWTCKEAYIKGRGVGLSLPLKKFSISLKDNKRADVVVDGAWDDGRPWRLSTLSVNANYVAALASASPVRGICRFTWNG